MQTILAHFDGKNIVPDQPLSLPAGQALRLVIESVAPVIAGLPPELEEQEKGMIVVHGTRIPLYLVLEAMYAGKTPVEILADYPSIPANSLPQIKRFVEQNDAVMRQHYEAERAELDRQYAEGKKAPSIETLRARAATRMPLA